MKLNNRYYLMRHGEAFSNVKNVISCWPEKFHNPLTQKGVGQVRAVAKKLKNKRVDFVIASDLLRTKQTAEIIARELKLKPKFDKRLREYQVGEYNGASVSRFSKMYPTRARFEKKPKGGECYGDIIQRMTDALRDVDKKYHNKTVVIVSHKAPLALLEFATEGIDQSEMLKAYFSRGLALSEVKVLR